MELYWSDKALAFKVHMKENQVLKYLNEGSCHTSSCFKSIPHGIHRRLSVLTSLTPENEDTLFNELYPEHHTKALELADKIESTVDLLFSALASAGFGDIYQHTNNSSNFVISTGLPG